MSSPLIPLVLFTLGFLGLQAAHGNNLDGCPINVRNSQTLVFQNKCYQFVLSESKEWKDALKYCERKANSGLLAMVKSAEINNFITKSLQEHFKYNGRVWIGLEDFDWEGHFQWVDGSKMKYNNFIPGDEGPRGGLNAKYEDCVAIDTHSNGKWRDYRCIDFWIFKSEHKHFVCEFPYNPPPTTTMSTTTTTTTTTTTSTDNPTTTTTENPTTITTGNPTTITTGNPTTKISETTNAEPSTKTKEATTKSKTFSIKSSPEATITPTTKTRHPSSTNAVGTTPGTIPKTTACPELFCTLECGMIGYKQNEETGCLMCECDDE